MDAGCRGSGAGLVLCTPSVVLVCTVVLSVTIGGGRNWLSYLSNDREKTEERKKSGAFDVSLALALIGFALHIYICV